MPVKDQAYWEQRAQMQDACHYLDKWTDWYAQVVRRRGVRRVWPKDVVWSVLDVGCGDGKVSDWMRKTFAWRVDGIDAFEFEGVRDRVDDFVLVDGECIAQEFAGCRYGLVTCHTSLAFMTDWRETVRQLAQITDRVLVVENVQTPTPEWQKGLPQKTHLELPLLIEGFAAAGFSPTAIQPINWLDRGLMVRPLFRLPIMKPLGVLLTLLVDWFMVDVIRIKPERGRYAAILFEKNVPPANVRRDEGKWADITGWSDGTDGSDPVRRSASTEGDKADGS
ncbi:MAG: class I SAM-dependent methyltransferase [Hyphomicrobiaceae bacterium]|nr:MAG: class I SAM-dependent methyltransferase [Hyphomicrobiaceae bacterium]